MAVLDVSKTKLGRMSISSSLSETLPRSLPKLVINITNIYNTSTRVEVRGSIKYPTYIREKSLLMTQDHVLSYRITYLFAEWIDWVTQLWLYLTSNTTLKNPNTVSFPFQEDRRRPTPINTWTGRTRKIGVWFMYGRQ